MANDRTGHLPLQSAQSPHRTRASIPADLIPVILEYTDRRTSHVLLTACCRAYYHAAVRSVYRDIVIASPRQLRCFARTAQQARTDLRLAGYFGHTRSFAYALTADSGPIQPHTLLSGPSASSLAKDRKLYYSLGDIAYYTHPPPASPECRCNATSPPEPLRTCLHGSSTTAEAIPIFPNLKTATFDPLPASDSQDVIASSRTLQRQTPFLSQVETVILQHTPGTPHDNAPNFYILGLTSVKTLHLHHLLGAEVNFSFDVSRYLGFQSELSTVYFHVANHARYVLGDTNHDTPAGRSETAQDRIHGDVVDMDLSPDQPLDTPAGTTPAANDRHRQNDRDFFWYMSEYVDALARGISRLIHRRTPGGPHSRRRTASLPALQTIVVELPWSPPAATSANASSITHAQSDRTGGALRQNEQNLLLTAKASILDTFQWDEVEGIPPPPDNTIVQVRLEDGQAWNLNIRRIYSEPQIRIGEAWEQCERGSVGV